MGCALALIVLALRVRAILCAARLCLFLVEIRSRIVWLLPIAHRVRATFVLQIAASLTAARILRVRILVSHLVLQFVEAIQT